MKNLLKAAGKVIGSIEGNTLKKKVRGSKHMLRRPPSWAIDAAALQQAESQGVQRVEVFDTEARRLYIADLPTIRQKGFLLQRGYGFQIALPLERWTCREATL